MLSRRLIRGLLVNHLIRGFRHLPILFKMQCRGLQVFHSREYYYKFQNFRFSASTKFNTNVYWA